MSGFLEIWNLSKSFRTPKGDALIVRDFNLQIREGEFICLIGHSGCGKSTVLSMVSGLAEKSGGGIVLAGREIDGPGPDRGVVFQSPCLFPWLTALENVLLGVEEVRKDASRAEQQKIAEHSLRLVGLEAAMRKRPAELSAGMRQRVGLARAFALHPKMLLLDEPFGALDSLTRLELQEILIDLWTQDRKTALMVTHDVDEALFLADRVAMMTSGPAATLGAIVEIPFPRPRRRQDVLDHPEYDALRGRILNFLEEQSHPREDERPGRPAPARAERPAGEKASEGPPMRLSSRNGVASSPAGETRIGAGIIPE